MVERPTNLTNHLCARFLSASERFPGLEFVAVVPAKFDDFDRRFDGLELRTFPMPPKSLGWRHVLRHFCHGCDLLHSSVIWLGDLRGGYSGPPVASALWNCAFVYRRSHLWPWSHWRAKAQHRNGVQAFINLATTAVTYFLPPGEGGYMGDATKSETTAPEKRWLAHLFRLGYFEEASDELALVLRLKGNAFATSALAVERLQPLPASYESPADEPLSALVTLDQVAPLTGLSKRSLERYRQAGRLPDPDIYGGQGKANKWHWHNLRPALSAVTGKVLPEVFPGDRIV